MSVKRRLREEHFFGSQFAGGKSALWKKVVSQFSQEELFFPEAFSFSRLLEADLWIFLSFFLCQLALLNFN